MDIAYQLYTSRKAVPLTGQFPFLKSVGYEHIEVWPGAYQSNPKEFRGALDDAGLDAPSVLIPDPGETDDLKRYIDTAHVLGGKVIVRPGLPADRRPSEQEGWKRLADRLSREATVVDGEGLIFAWHNHDFEFFPLQDGSRPIDLIVNNSSPNVRLELDCGWVFQAGGDIETELKRFSSRIIAIHAKDAAPLGTKAEDGWVAHGDGVIDWQALLPTILSTGAVLAVVEHDEPSDWQYVAKRSYESSLPALQRQERGQMKGVVGFTHVRHGRTRAPRNLRPVRDASKSQAQPGCRRERARNRGNWRHFSCGMSRMLRCCRTGSARILVTG